MRSSGGSRRPSDEGGRGRRSQKTFFSALRSQFGLKTKNKGGPPRDPPLRRRTVAAKLKKLKES